MQKFLTYVLILELIAASALFSRQQQRTRSHTPALNFNTLPIVQGTSSAPSPWIVQSSGVSTELMSVCAVNANVAWVCGAAGVVLRTTNGGTVWTRVDPTNWTCVSVFALDANTAWIVGHDSATSNSAIFKTTDGGRNWTQPTSSNDPTTYWQDVAFFDSFNGVLHGNPEKGYYAIYTTTDGGNSWTRVPATSIPVPVSGEVCLPNNAAISGSSVWFTARQSNSGFPRIFRSSDRGKTWTAGSSITTLGSSIPSISFSSETIGLAAGANGAVVRTTNGGTDWSNPISTGLNAGGSLQFASSVAAVLLNLKGLCAVSIDGGRTWTLASTPDTVAMRSVSFSPAADGWAVGSKGTIWQWDRGTLNNPPSLVSPLDAATNLPTPVTLSWQNASGGGNYRLQVALSAAFSPPLVLEDSTLTATSSQLTAVAYNSTYFWRVRSESAFGSGPWSTVRSFSTVSTKSVSSPSITFPESPAASTDYRLVSFPGMGSVRIDKVLTGTQKTDWRMFGENGQAIPQNLEELSPTSSSVSGQGYWLVKKGPFTFSANVTMPPLSPDGTSAIHVGAGWNIIGNPFDVPVNWGSIKSLNQVTKNLWSYGGSSGFQLSSTLEPFIGYYYFNESGAGELRIPYPFPSMNVTAIPAPGVDWKIQLSLETERNSDHENFIGVSSSSKDIIDELNQPKPPAFSDQASISLTRSNFAGLAKTYSSDFRPAVGEGQVWDFAVNLQRASDGKIRFIGIESVPVVYDVVLVGSGNEPIDLRTTNEFIIKDALKSHAYRLIVGSKSFVDEKIIGVVPAEFGLSQNYPNPFNPSTSIGFQIPTPGFVKVSILDVLGREVGTLVNELRSEGFYTVRWDASSSPSGVYFSRLAVNGKVIHTRKMLLIR